jgi:hypothetical protein
MNDEIVYVLFLNSRNDDHPLNKITSFLGEKIHGRGFSHVEFGYRNPVTKAFVSTSIYNGDDNISKSNVKTFANPDYVVCTIPVGRAQHNSMTAFIDKCHASRIPFSRLSMCQAILPFQLLSSNKHGTCCSKYVTEILQAGKITCSMKINANITSPSKLFKIIHLNIPQTMGTVPYKSSIMQT